MLFPSHEYNGEKIFGKQGMIFAFHWMVSSDAENPQLLIFEILARRQFLQDLRLSMFSRVEKKWIAGNTSVRRAQVLQNMIQLQRARPLRGWYDISTSTWDVCSS